MPSLRLMGYGRMGYIVKVAPVAVVTATSDSELLDVWNAPQTHANEGLDACVK
ncbi:MAG: hypothetical protein IKP37_08845 [Paludibacteraceae bacterium]|nr:hypothetical protein [Paludibacteraceae bacterium]